VTAWVLPVLREARDGLTRHPALTALATLSMAVSLYVLGMFLLIAWNVRLTTTALGRELQMQVYMRPGADAEAIETIRQGLRSDDAVAEARLVTADEARRRFAERFPRLAGLSEGLGPDLFPTSFEVVLRESHRGPEEAERLAKAYRVGPGVDEIRFDRGWFERLTALFDLFRSGGYGVGALLVLAVMVTVGAIVRLTVLARREEIEIMKLVGATDAFVAAPFLLEGLLQGLLGAGAAVLALLGVHGLVVPRLASAFAAAGGLGLADTLPPVLLLSLLGGGATIGLLASALAVGRALRRP